MNEEDSRDWRWLIGNVAAWTSLTCLLVGAFCLVLIFVPNTFSDFTNRFLIRALEAACIISIMTFVLAFFGRDRTRAFAVAISIVSVLLFGSILGAGE